MVDFFHAAEQLKASTDAAYGERNTHGRAQYEKHRQVLRHEHGGVEWVIRALRYLRAKHPRRKRINEVLGYFCRNRKRMNYAGGGATWTADRLRRGRGSVQDAGHRTYEALGDALATRRRPSDPDATRLGSEWSLRDRLVVALGNLSPRSNRLGRHRVDPWACRLIRQFKTHTLSFVG